MRELKLKQWIEEFGGASEVAEALGVCEHQIRAWLRAECTPRSKTLYEMIKLSKGFLTFEIIYKETTRNN